MVHTSTGFALALVSSSASQALGSCLWGPSIEQPCNGLRHTWFSQPGEIDEIRVQMVCMRSMQACIDTAMLVQPPWRVNVSCTPYLSGARLLLAKVMDVCPGVQELCDEIPRSLLVCCLSGQCNAEPNPEPTPVPTPGECNAPPPTPEPTSPTLAPTTSITSTTTSTSTTRLTSSCSWGPSIEQPCNGLRHIWHSRLGEIGEIKVHMCCTRGMQACIDTASLVQPPWKVNTSCNPYLSGGRLWLAKMVDPCPDVKELCDEIPQNLLDCCLLGECNSTHPTPEPTPVTPPGECNEAPPTLVPTPVPTTPSPTLTPMPTPQPTAMPTPEPTPMPTPQPTAMPTPEPTPVTTPELKSEGYVAAPSIGMMFSLLPIAKAI